MADAGDAETSVGRRINAKITATTVDAAPSSRRKCKQAVELMTIDKSGQDGGGPEQLRPARMQIETTVLMSSNGESHPTELVDISATGALLRRPLGWSGHAGQSWVLDMIFGNNLHIHLESVLARDSRHVGANHYYIHATEASLTRDRALESARRLETLVPSAGHLVHMPAHTYMRTGNYAGAVKANAAAAEVDRQYIAAAGPNGFYPTMYYNHNLDFLASAAMMTTQCARASQGADGLVENVTRSIED